MAYREAVARPRVCIGARSGCLQTVPQRTNTDTGVLLPPLLSLWDKGTLSPFILNDIGYHIVLELELLNSTALSGTTDGK